MNSNSNCHNLDAYLSDDLPGDKNAIFESHLEGCPACRDAVDQLQWIDDLLHSAARSPFDLPSVAIVESLRISVAQRRRRIMKTAYGLAAAATVLIAIGLLKLNRQANETLETQKNRGAVSTPVHAAIPIRPAATFVGTSDAIVVPLESSSADVTVVQVYPTTDTERRWRLEAALSTNL